MATDPPAMDLGALRAGVDLAIAWLNGDLTYVPQDWTPSEAGPDVARLLAAFDAQAARLAAAHEALGLACVVLRFWPHGEPTATLAKCRTAFAMIDGAVGAGEGAMGDGVAGSDWTYDDDPRVATLQTRLTAAEAERDRERVSAQYWYGQTCHFMERTARLVALETAARAWAEVFTSTPVQEPWYSPWRALLDAVRDLDAPTEPST